MPKRLQAITYNEVRHVAMSHLMDTLADSISTQVVLLDCVEKNEDGTPHYCMYNLALDRGWLIDTSEYIIHPATNLKAKVYQLTPKGADAFCRQFLLHDFDSGDVCDLMNDLFRNHPEEYKEWKNLIQRHKVSEAIENNT